MNQQNIATRTQETPRTFPRRSRNVTLTAITMASIAAFSGCAKNEVKVEEDKDKDHNISSNITGSSYATSDRIYVPSHSVWIYRPMSPGYHFMPAPYVPHFSDPDYSPPRVNGGSGSTYIRTGGASSGGSSGSSGFSSPSSHPSSTPHATPSFGGFGGTGHGASGGG